MKKIIALLLCALPLAAMAQKTHTVAAKETLFSIGRLYNVHPRALAEYNHIPFDKGLSLGQVLKIPSSAAPMPQTAATATVPEKPAEPIKKNVLEPEKKSAPIAQELKNLPAIYYTVQPKEGLYGISKRFNTSIENIKKWNHLSGESLTIGEKLIVGYENGNAKTEIVQTPINKNSKKQDEPEIIKEKVEMSQSKPVQEQPSKTTVTSLGFFQAKYQEQSTNKNLKSETGLASTFKSTSGWDDGKFYCLYNMAPAGTIVKITSAQTQKIIYAKVLDVIPEMKQNDALTIIVSNAAAASLGDGETNFNCSVQY